MHPPAEVQVVKLEPGTPQYNNAVAFADVSGEEIAARFGRGAVFGMAGGPPRGRPLRFWVDAWGSYSSEITGPDGRKHPVSVEPWRDEDHDTTFIAITLRYIDPARVVTKPHTHCPTFCGVADARASPRCWLPRP